jgi:hypothetical protein
MDNAKFIIEVQSYTFKLPDIQSATFFLIRLHFEIIPLIIINITPEGSKYREANIAEGK